MGQLRLERPLVIFDLESTGTDPTRDRIVEISVLRIDPDGARVSKTRRIQPGCRIPPEATAIHGIRDEDVAGAPTFRQIARSLLELLGDADLGGFNVRRFDVPLLEREFREAGHDLGLAERRVIDVMTIYHRKEPRDLSAAVRFFLDREHAGAHSAEADVGATFEVLEAQLDRYPDLPDDVERLADWCAPTRPGAADREGKFLRQGERVVFAFGKHRGRPLDEIAVEAPDYLRWILEKDFPEDACDLVRAALDAAAGASEGSGAGASEAGETAIAPLLAGGEAEHAPAAPNAPEAGGPVPGGFPAGTAEEGLGTESSEDLRGCEEAGPDRGVGPEDGNHERPVSEPPPAET